MMRIKNPLNSIETIASITIIVLCVIGANVSHQNLENDTTSLYWQDNFIYLQDSEMGESISANDAFGDGYWRIEDVFEKM